MTSGNVHVTGDLWICLTVRTELLYSSPSKINILAIELPAHKFKYVPTFASESLYCKCTCTCRWWIQNSLKGDFFMPSIFTTTMCIIVQCTCCRLKLFKVKIILTYNIYIIFLIVYEKYTFNLGCPWFVFRR